MATETHGHTHRLDLDDSTVREWDATVLSSDAEQGIVLDRSAFYPGGGGQPPDEGVLLWGGVRTRIAGTRKGDELYLIPVEGDPVPPAGTTVRGALDDERRTALMRSTPACTCSPASSSGTSARWSPAATWSRARRAWTSTSPRCRRTSRSGSPGG